MQRQQKEETQAMVYELVRKEKSKGSLDKRGENLEKQVETQQAEIQSLKDMITKMSKTE